MPDYKQIYIDIVEMKFPEKRLECIKILEKEKLSALDVLHLNQIIFGKITLSKRQKYRAYNKTDIMKILDFQKKHKLNNTQVALHFHLSRNTISKWKKLFLR
ncbi:helix-turn-helix domain-containing protein [Empedobacter brevis]|uniref:helix-turn-helix domain-containing protein n=1 Tax=Empedobacter brevis TaxID=247 RepID=UPI00123CA6B7|nr:helix-turn-helix domain-containing protein [Empedobacter brevis]QES93950.1 helix-turn-helix domain-containing protein [Empedobacter brevis]